MKHFRFLWAAALVSALLVAFTGFTLAQGRMTGGPMLGHPAQAQAGPQREMISIMQQSHLRIMNQQMTGNTDRDFAHLMLQQHQATMDAARVELRYGKNAQTRQMAEELIRTRQQEMERTRTMLSRMGG